jgi:hypothetical protein
MFVMSKPIYKVWLVKMKGASYEMTPEEVSQHLDKIDEALEKVGGERVITCNSVWCSENYEYWGVEKFPDIEAVQKHAELLLELNHYKYTESTSYLGTEYNEG